MAKMIVKLISRARSRINLWKTEIEISSKVRRMSELGLSQVGFTSDGKHYRPGDEVNFEDWLPRSLVYTLYMAINHSAILIINLDRLNIPFVYADAQMILRSMLERTIHQKYITLDPIRLGRMYILWEIIENRRLGAGLEEISDKYPDSVVLQVMGGDRTSRWTEQDEREFRDAKQEWESLVMPGQKAERARSWSGLSLGAMAEECGLTDYYKSLYRTTSWYAHGLAPVADYYLRRKDREQGTWVYSFAADENTKLECYLYTLVLLELSSYTVDEFLAWGIGHEIARIVTERPSLYSWLRELVASI
jgi:hypothetical protein